MAKKARELAVKERRDRKLEKRRTAAEEARNAPPGPADQPVPEE